MSTKPLISDWYSFVGYPWYILNGIGAGMSHPEMSTPIMSTPKMSRWQNFNVAKCELS